MRFRLIPLEERIVLDAALAVHFVETQAIQHLIEHGGVVTESHDSITQHTHDKNLNPGENIKDPINLSTPTQVLVISDTIKDPLQLADAVNKNTLVVMYDPSSTSLSQLSQIIANKLDGRLADSIAFASEGSAGQFSLTQGLYISINSLDSNADLHNFWTNIGNLLKTNGRVDLLACDVASDSQGVQLVNELDQNLDATGKSIEVAAATGLVGNPADGGSWTLEIGNVDAARVYFNSTSLAHWDNVLARPSPTINANPTTGLQENVGQSQMVLLGTFTDSSGDTNPADFSGMIQWGTNSGLTLDGLTTNATITYDSVNNVFDVYGTNGFNQNGTYSVVTNLNYTNGDVNGASINTSDLVSNQLSLAVAFIEPAQNVTFSGSVATFTDSQANGNVSQYTATDDWGDGTTADTLGTIVNNGNGTFSVVDSHSYGSTIGSGIITVTLSDSLDNVTATASANDANAPVDITSVAGINVPIGTSEAGALLGTFTYASDPSAIASDFIASVNYGGGNGLTSAIVQADSNVSGQFDVYATNDGPSNTVDQSGLHTLTLNVTYNLGATTTTTALAADFFSQQAYVVTPNNSIAVNEGNTSNMVLATFTDPNLAQDIGSYTAAINWGDNSPLTTAIFANFGIQAVSGQSNEYEIVEAHPYQLSSTNNLEQVSITLSNYGSFAENITVNDAPLTQGITNPVQVVEGTPIPANTILTTFSDGNLLGSSDQFTASITWENINSNGDSYTNNGNIVPAGAPSSGEYNVEGSYTYLEPGNHPFIITVQDKGGQTLTVDSTVDVSEAAVAGNILQPLTSTEGQSFNGNVADITIGTPTPNFNDFSAQIIWGDGNSSAGSLGLDGNGGYYISGNHTYANQGSYPLTVDIYNINTTTPETVLSGENFTVNDVPITTAPANISAAEGVSSTETVATITDPGVNTGYNITINWGDGSSNTVDTNTAINTSSIQLDPIGGDSYNVVATHSFQQFGNLNVTVTVNDLDGPFGNSISTVSPATVADAPINPISSSTIAYANESSTFTVATFIDPSPNATAGEFSASVNWGDNTTGSTSDGLGDLTIVADSSVAQQYDIIGTHNFQDVNPGTTVNVSIADNVPNGSTASVTSVVNVLDPISAQPVNFNPGAEGSFFINNTPVASFTDANTAENNPADFTATIDWGNHTSSTGTVVYANGTDSSQGFIVEGTNIYALAGNFTVSVTVTDNNDTNISTTVAQSIEVANAPIVVTADPLAGQTEGLPFNAQVASILDTDTFSPLDYTTSINWGDGTANSVGTLSNVDANNDAPVAGLNFLSGRHTYTDPGNYTLTVTVTDVNGAFYSNSESVSVLDAAVNITTSNLSATKGEAIPDNTVLGFFTSQNSALSLDSSHFSVSINWGDGTPSTPGEILAGGVITDGSNGHIYTQYGVDNITLLLTEINGGRTTNANDQVTIQDSAINNLIFFPPTFTEGEPSGLQVVATFFDTDTSISETDFNATINWGDNSGAQSVAVASLGSGHYEVLAQHTYTLGGTYQQSLTITDNGGVVTGSTPASAAPSTISGVVDDQALIDFNLNTPSPQLLGVSENNVILGSFVDPNGGAGQ